MLSLLQDSHAGFSREHLVFLSRQRLHATSCRWEISLCSMTIVNEGMMTLNESMALA
jgi:hypothetical protein